MSVLVTGFDPFENDHYNVSGAIADALNGENINGQTITGATLPVERYKALEVLESLVDACDPQVVIALGYAKMANAIRLERFAINCDDFRIQDNAHNQPLDEPIYVDAPLAYKSTLPIKRATKALRDQGIKADISNSAGTYLCNHVFFGGLHLAQSVGFKSGFVHIPPDEKLASDDTGKVMAFETQCQAIMTIAKIALEFDHDIKSDGLVMGYE